MCDKVHTSMRLRRDSYGKLDELVRFYQREYKALGIRISRATVMEIVINEKANELKINQSGGMRN